MGISIGATFTSQYLAMIYVRRIRPYLNFNTKFANGSRDIGEMCTLLSFIVLRAVPFLETGCLWSRVVFRMIFFSCDFLMD